MMGNRESLIGRGASVRKALGHGGRKVLREVALTRFASAASSARDRPHSGG
jgi:hypothetical protein